MGRYNTNGEFTERTTIYLTPEIKKGLQKKALENNTTLSAIINDELKTNLAKNEDSEGGFRISFTF